MEVEKLSKERIINKAKQEIDEELTKGYVKEYKSKLRELASAEKIVKNINLELKDLELKIGNELD